MVTFNTIVRQSVRYPKSLMSKSHHERVYVYSHKIFSLIMIHCFIGYTQSYWTANDIFMVIEGPARFL